MLVIMKYCDFNHDCDSATLSHATVHFDYYINLELPPNPHLETFEVNCTCSFFIPETPSQFE